MDIDANLWDEIGSLFEDVSQYKRLISKFIYLIVTRPDVVYGVGLVSHFMHKLGENHWKTALKILTYIKGSSGKRLLYKNNRHLRIEVFSDSNYAGDKRNRKSTIDYCTHIRGNLDTWSKK